MKKIPLRLQSKLRDRAAGKALRMLPTSPGGVDFTSNDYLGFARNQDLFQNALKRLHKQGLVQNGSTGSRLLSGNHRLYRQLEEELAKFHDVPAALIFNSGYDANLGFFSSVPQRGDLVFYDEWVHASIRDGIQRGLARSYKFAHNDLEDLKSRIELTSRDSNVARNPSHHTSHIYVVTESVFSMDGDSPDLKSFADFCLENGYYFIVDEAHAIGVHGEKGEGRVQAFNLQDQVFARVVTFGKALGCHGSAILGSMELKDYLVNFARSLMYTTALPPHSIATVQASYEYLVHPKGILEREKLLGIIDFFKKTVVELGLEEVFIKSGSAIHCCVIPGNVRVKGVAEEMTKRGFDVRPILPPTVPTGRERLRFCLHSFNTEAEIERGLKTLAKSLRK